MLLTLWPTLTGSPTGLPPARLPRHRRRPRPEPDEVVDRPVVVLRDEHTTRVTVHTWGTARATAGHTARVDVTSFSPRPVNPVDDELAVLLATVDDLDEALELAVLEGLL